MNGVPEGSWATTWYVWKIHRTICRPWHLGGRNMMTGTRIYFCHVNCKHLIQSSLLIFEFESNLVVGQWHGSGKPPVSRPKTIWKWWKLSLALCASYMQPAGAFAMASLLAAMVQSTTGVGSAHWAIQLANQTSSIPASLFQVESCPTFFSISESTLW